VLVSALLLAFTGIRGWLMEILAIQVALSGLPPGYADLVKRFLSGEPGLLVMALVLAPLLEELIFRWGAFRLFEWMGMPPPAVIALSTLVFAALHPAPQVPAAIAFGLLGGHLYQATRNLGWAIGAHFLWNLCGLVDGYLQRERVEALLVPNYVYSATHFPIAYLAVCLALSVVGLLLYRAAIRQETGSLPG
jgi:membrane protease YdiL (CAAX protease family)